MIKFPLLPFGEGVKQLYSFFDALSFCLEDEMQLSLFVLSVFEVPQESCTRCGIKNEMRRTQDEFQPGEFRFETRLLWGMCEECYKEWLKNAEKNKSERSKWG